MSAIGMSASGRRKLRRLLAAGSAGLAMAGLLGPLGLAARGTAATQAWAVQPSPVATAPQGQLASVSCVSATECMAVGSTVGPAGGVIALAERWNGTTWTVLSVPRPAGAVLYSLSGVSCPSASECIAVGWEHTSGSYDFPLAERWNGTTWTRQKAPHQGSNLYAVSCSSASACTAVGANDKAPSLLTMAERWNGTAWTLQKTPNANSYDSLTAVSCPSASTCTAIGYRGHRNQPLAERWNGATWAVQSIPDPGGRSSLTGVSCTSPTACTAVGDTHGTRAPALAERWNGSTWAVQAVPGPARDDLLAGVSCASSTVCTAVGTGYGGHGYTPSGTLAEAWNGKTWTTQSTPRHGGIVQLDAVSCPSATACTAAGANLTRTGVTLTEAWNGVNWAIQPSPSPLGAEASGLTGISCASATACMAVGGANDHTGASAGNDGTLAERWDGSRWAEEPTPQVPGAIRGYLSDNGLSAVSCTSANACTAVGHYRAPAKASLGYDAGLAERWNGTAWVVQPLPTSAEYSPLTGVSCPSATSCSAVGTFVKTNLPEGVLAEQWNGTTWAVQAVPDPPGSPTVGGVSCTSATACTLVGSYESGDSQLTLAEQWNGTTWTIRTTPNPAGSTGSYLTAVSCTSATACTAVGYASGTQAGSVEAPLAERWNGTAWAIQTTPNPAGSADTKLDAVSCTSATACTAVGSGSGAQMGTVAVAEHWNGTTWAIQATPDPGVSSNVLDAVSCQPAVPCTAAGSYDTTIGRPLVERRS